MASALFLLLVLDVWGFENKTKKSKKQSICKGPEQRLCTLSRRAGSGGIIISYFLWFFSSQRTGSRSWRYSPLFSTSKQKKLLLWRCKVCPCACPFSPTFEISCVPFSDRYGVTARLWGRCCPRKIAQSSNKVQVRDLFSFWQNFVLCNRYKPKLTDIFLCFVHMEKRYISCKWRIMLLYPVQLETPASCWRRTRCPAVRWESPSHFPAPENSNKDPVSLVLGRLNALSANHHTTIITMSELYRTALLCVKKMRLVSSELLVLSVSFD